MKISELRDWATATYGAHSHKEGQFFAALGPIEEWLGHLQRQGIALELHPIGESTVTLAAPLHGKDEPPNLVNAGAVGTETDALPAVFELPTQTPPQADPVAPKPPVENFVGGERGEAPKYAPSSSEAPSDHASAASSANT